MFRHRTSTRRPPAAVALAVLLGAPAICLAPPAVAPAAAASASPAPAAPLTGKRVNELAAPAVRLIVVDYDAEVAVYAPEVDNNATSQLADDPALVQAVRNGADPVSIVIDAIIANPDRFLQKAKDPETRSVSLEAVGSGFVVTPDGYVVTNAHVVDSGSDELKQGIVNTALQPLTKELTDNAAGELTGKLSQDQIDKLLKVVIDFVAKNMVVNKITTKVQAAEGTQVPGQDKQFKTAPAEIVTKGDPYPGKDVALLKVEGKDLPTLPLGDDADVDTGETLYALGYPANVTFLSDFTKSAQSTATLTDGVVSAKKQVSGGYTAIQTNAAISGGNSGGPALDDQGKVVGLTTAGLVSGEDKTGGAYSFVVPVGVAREFLQRSNVTPVESQATSLWRSALNDFDRSHFVGASATLRQLDSLNPGRPDVQAKLRDSDAKVAAGLDRTPKKSSGPGALVWVVIGVAVLLAAVLALLALRRRSRRAPAAAGPYPPSPSPAWGGATPGWGAPTHGSVAVDPAAGGGSTATMTAPQGLAQPDPFARPQPPPPPPQPQPQPQPDQAPQPAHAGPPTGAPQPFPSPRVPPPSQPSPAQQPQVQQPPVQQPPVPQPPGQPAAGPALGFPIYPGQPGYPDNPPFPGYPVYPGQPGYPQSPPR